MKKTNLLKLLTLGLLVGGAVTAVAGQSVDASDVEERGPRHGRGGMMFMSEDIERTVETIDNGVVITLTTDDEEALEKLLDMPSDMPEDAPFADEVTREITVLENGVQITLTSEDADVVEHLQSMPEGPNVDRSVENIDNGIVITLTSEDSDVVEMLQSGDFHHGGRHGFRN